MEMCSAVGASLQSGMNFRLRGADTIVLMSQRLGAPYADRVEDEGRVLIYEGHDDKNDGKTNPKELDQPEFRPSVYQLRMGVSLKLSDDTRKAHHRKK